MTQVDIAKREILSHWCELCEAGQWWKAQAWRSANDLAERFPREFGDLPELLTKAMKEKNDAAAS